MSPPSLSLGLRQNTRPYGYAGVVAHHSATLRFLYYFVEKLVKDRAALLAFYDFPAEHWVHIRTTNPIESSFATIRHRTTRTKNCVSRNTLLGLVFQLALTAERSWRKLGGFKLLPDVVAGVRFEDGLRVEPQPDDSAADSQQLAA